MAAVRKFGEKKKLEMMHGTESMGNTLDNAHCSLLVATLNML